MQGGLEIRNIFCKYILTAMKLLKFADPIDHVSCVAAVQDETCGLAILTRAFG